jgi:hypothetical protein
MAVLQRTHISLSAVPSQQAWPVILIHSLAACPDKALNMLSRNPDDLNPFIQGTMHN